MKGPWNRSVDSDESSSFAPKWIREAVRATGWDTRSKGFGKLQDDALSQSEPLINASDEAMAIEALRMPSSFEPMQPSKALPGSGSRSPIGMLWRPTLAIAVTAGLAFLVVGRPWAMWTSGANKSGGESSSFLSLSLTQARAEPANDGRTKLIVNEATPRPMDDAIPLGVSVRNPDDDTILIFVGFVKGTALSIGRPLGDDTWWLYAKDLNNVMIRPPSHFVGTMDITAELRHAAETAIEERRPLRFEWVEAKNPNPNVQSQAQVPASNLQSPSIHQLAPEEIAGLMKRGNDLILAGDLAAARLVLRRAAEAGDARAALALAGTYDPVMLKKLPLHGLSPDLAMARHWYEKAKELGSPDALRRLEMLARRPD
jgi:hypothetical protein